jgi:hypothetical protein
MAHCSQNPLNSNCSCNPVVGSSDLARVFDPESQNYICCGTVPFKVSGTDLPSFIQSIPESTGICAPWWSKYATGEAPVSEIIKLTELLQVQDHISSVMKPAVISSDRKTSTCALGRVPRRAKMPNINKGTPYLDLVVCTSQGSELSANPDFNKTGITTYFIDGCSKTDNICTLTAPIALSNNNTIDAISTKPVKPSVAAAVAVGTSSDTVAATGSSSDTAAATGTEVTREQVTKPFIRLTSPLTGRDLTSAETNMVLGIILSLIALVIIVGLMFYMFSGRGSEHENPFSNNQPYQMPYGQPAMYNY